MRNFVVVDLFCGAGGTSTGIALAAEELGAKLDLVAVNHWQTAVDTHSANHPWAEHRCANLEGLEPWDVLGNRRVDVLVASPECTHHSSARGGVPMSDQSRASAWHVIRWVEALRPRAVLIENVPEFRSWGPLGVNGRPMKSKAGALFDSWISNLENLGYSVGVRVLNAADYGDATTRRRLFVVAVRGRASIPWPIASHAKDPTARGLFADGAVERWRAARDVIDWTLPSRSIFNRKKPLAASTMRRIEEGLRRFGGDGAEPFLAILRGTSGARSLDKPVPALTAGGEHVALVQPEPFVLGQQSGGIARPVSEPAPTVAAKGALALIEPFIVPRYSEREGQRPRTHNVDEPLPALPCTVQHELCEPFVIPQGNESAPRSTGAPVGTITTTSRGVRLVEPFVVTIAHGAGDHRRVRSVDAPLPTVTTSNQHALAEAVGYDVRLRMLQPHELAAAMSFPDAYEFKGTKSDVVRQIGNAVPIRVARALAGGILRRIVGASA